MNEARKPNLSRRGFLKGAASAPAALAGAKAEAPAAGDISQLLNQFRSSAGVCDSIAGRHLNWAEEFITATSPEVTEPRDLQDFTKSEAEAARLTALIPQQQQLLQQISRAIGEGITYLSTGRPNENILDRAAANGILTPEGLAKAWEEQKREYEPLLAKFRHIMPRIKAKVERQWEAWRKLESAVRQANPEADEGDIQSMIKAASRFVPKQGMDWGQYFQQDRHVAEAVVPVTQEHRKKVERTQVLTETDSTQDRQQRNEAYLQGIAKKLGASFGRATHSDSTHVYLEIPSPSEAIYRALRNTITLRDPDAEFPAMKDMFVARLEENGNNPSWVPCDIRVPPAGYDARLPAHMAQELIRAANGRTSFPDVDSFSGDPHDAPAYYRAEAESQSMMRQNLADDLERLQSLLKGKWTERTQQPESSERQR